MPTALTAEGEQHWQELRQHLEWNRGFALFFYFASETAVTDIFKKRLSNFFIGQTTRPQEIHYQPNQPDWVDATLNGLLERDGHWQMLNAPVWLALHHFQNNAALIDYRRLLSGLNERRDVWRKNYLAPIIFVLPESLKPEMSSLAPDLWSVRALSETLNQTLLQNFIAQQSHGPSPVVSGAPVSQSIAISASKQSLIDEWERLLEKVNKAPKREYLITADRAVNAYQKSGQLIKAQHTAEVMHSWAKALNEKTPESLRDLSVSLDNVGGVAQQQGRWGDAQMAYEESLEIRRRLKELLGETPESLRDVAVSLSNLGHLFEGKNDLTQAENCYQEGLALGQRLTKMLPDLPAYTEIEAFFQKRLDVLVSPHA